MGTTTNNALPYPEPTDPIADGAVAIKNLANAVDTKLAKGIAAGQVSVANVGANATATTVVTLPVGRFTVAPNIIVSPLSSSPNVRAVSVVSGATASSFTMALWNGSGASSTCAAYWYAVITI